MPLYGGSSEVERCLEASSKVGGSIPSRHISLLEATMLKVTYFKMFAVYYKRNPDECVALFADKDKAERWAQANGPNAWTMKELLLDPNLFTCDVGIKFSLCSLGPYNWMVLQ